MAFCVLELAICILWRLLWIEQFIMDVHNKKISFKHGLSNDIFKLRFWTYCSCCLFPRTGRIEQMVRYLIDNNRMLYNRNDIFNNMKRLIWILSAFVYSLYAMPQKGVDAVEQSSMIQKFEKVAGEVRSMQCSFRQVKTLNMLNEELISTGVMFYHQPALLRWQYLKPYEYTFVISDSQVMIKNTDRLDVIDINQSKIFKEITQIMVNSVTGRCLTEKKDFDVTMYNDKDEWIADLRPLKKELKSLFKTIKLHINPQKCMISQVELIEQTGDMTHIYLYDYKINVDIDEKMFTVD